MVTLEVDPARAAVARANLRRAGVDGVAEVRVGPALDTLPLLAAEAPFDLVFIDADKANLATYVERALELARPGALVIVDNVVRGGRILDPGDDEQVRGVVRALGALQCDDRVQVSITQTVGEKGWDGFAVIRKVAP